MGRVSLGAENNPNIDAINPEKNIWIRGFNADVAISCPKCRIMQYNPCWISVTDLDYKKRILNFECRTSGCLFKSSFLFYLGMELT